MSAQYVLRGHMSVQYALSGQFCSFPSSSWSVDTSALIKLSKGPERGQIELSKLLSQHFCCSNNCMSMDGQDVTMAASMGAVLKEGS